MEEIEITTKVLLFSGAGLSCPLGLPMTNGFSKAINNGAPDLTNQLRSYLGDKFEDIEAVLTAVEELNRDGIIYTYIKDRIRNSSYSNVNNDIVALRRNTMSYTIALKKAVHELLKTKDVNTATQLYSSIIKEVRETISNSAISFFTANYDLTFEESIGDLEDAELRKLGIRDIEDGFVVKGRSRIFSPYKEYSWSTDTIEYKKIHGSLGWYIDAKGRTTCSNAANTPDNPDSVPMLYPGFKGVPDKDPFVSLHNQLLQRFIAVPLKLKKVL